MPKANAAPHTATSATDGTMIRLVKVAVIYATLGQIVGPYHLPAESALISSGYQV